MASLGSLVVSLAVDTARFQGDLGRAAQMAESRMRNIKDVSTKALGLITVAATAAGAALGYALKSAIDRADNMRDLAQSAGVTVEQLSRLEYAGKTSGVGIEVIGKALVKLAKEGVPDANAALFDFADQVSKMRDGTAKTALVVDRFGERIGPGLIPMLNLGRDGLIALSEQSDRFGATITTQAAGGADQFNDSLAALNLVATGFSNTLAADLLPSLNAVAGKLVESAEAAQGLQDQAHTAAQIMRGLAVAVSGVLLVIDVLGKSIGARAAQLTALLHLDVRQALTIGEDLQEGVYAEAHAWNELRKAIYSTGEQAKVAKTRLEAISRPGGSAILAQPDKEKPASLRPLATHLAAGEIDAVAALYDEFNTATQTAQERALADWTAFDAKVHALLVAGQITAEEAAKRISESNAEMLQPITITAEKIFPKAEREQLSEFWTQASRNTQDILANWLYDPFEEGIQGMLKSFGQMLLQMASQALAADIAGKIFGTGGAGSGGGLLGSFIGWAGGLLSGGGGAAASVAGGSAPVMMGPYAKGGYIRPGTWGMTGEEGPEPIFGGRTGITVVPHSSGMSVTNHFTISAPQGTVSRATQQQIAAAAARGISAASARNS